MVPLKLSPAPPGRLEQPIIVSRELGTLKIGDLPLRSIEGGMLQVMSFSTGGAHTAMWAVQHRKEVFSRSRFL